MSPRGWVHKELVPCALKKWPRPRTDQLMVEEWMFKELLIYAVGDHSMLRLVWPLDRKMQSCETALEKVVEASSRGRGQSIFDHQICTAPSSARGI
jgi:hypothetical protein